MGRLRSEQPRTRAEEIDEVKCRFRCSCNCGRDDESGGDVDINGDENEDRSRDCHKFELSKPIASDF